MLRLGFGATVSDTLSSRSWNKHSKQLCTAAGASGGCIAAPGWLAGGINRGLNTQSGVEDRQTLGAWWRREGRSRHSYVDQQLIPCTAAAHCIQKQSSPSPIEG